jgi:isopenicillin N synthase-like dioxygenase
VATRLCITYACGNRACEEVGFFIITNHGVPKPIIDRAWRSCRAYFDLPLHIKGAVDVAMTEAYPYGYCGVGGEILSKGKDYETGKVSVAAPDLKVSTWTFPLRTSTLG